MTATVVEGAYLCAAVSAEAGPASVAVEGTPAAGVAVEAAGGVGGAVAVEGLPASLVAVEAASVSLLVEVAWAAEVVVADSGFPGPRGEPGPAGASHLHTQTAPSTLWVVNHNLGQSPAVELRANAGDVFHSNVLHTTANQFTVSNAYPIAGSAYSTL